MRITILIISMPLLLSLTSCNLLPNIVRYHQEYQASKGLLKGISPWDEPCTRAEKSNQTEIETRKAIIAQTSKAFSLERFEDLEKYHQVYQRTKARTSSGIWKLEIFYSSIFNNDLASASDSKEDEKVWSGVEEKILRWIQAYPESPAPYLAYSTFLNMYAWSLRGNDFSGDTSREKFRLFNEKIAMQKDVLEKSKLIASSDPEWYADMLEVAIAQNWSRPEVKELLREAISKELYYKKIYRNGFEYLLPKWHGSFEEAEDFAVDASTITSKCEGKSMYARIYWHTLYEQFEFTTQPLNLQKGSWANMSKGFDDIIKFYPDSWNINTYARLACLAGDEVKARELLTMIGDKPYKPAWENYEIKFSDCKKLVE